MVGIVMEKPKEKSWIRYIKQRIQQNKNALIFVSGQTGSSKSWSCISIGEQLDPEFNIDRIVFSVEALMELLNSGKIKKGSAIVFEELGVEHSHKTWASITNKMLNYLVQTFRHLNIVLLMNSPHMDFIDSSTRKLFHAELRAMSIDFKKKEARLNPQLISYNSRMQKFYYRYLRVATKNGVETITCWRVAKPKSDTLIKEYEAKKLQYTKQLRATILMEVKKAKQKKTKMNCKQCNHNWITRKSSSAFPVVCPSCHKNPY